RPVADVVKREDFPRGCLFIATELPSDDVQVIEGNTVIKGGSRVIMAAHRPDLPRLLRYLSSAGKNAPAGSQAEALQAMGQVGFLSGVAQEDLADLAAGARLGARAAGDEVYRAASASEHFYVLRSGAVELQAADGSTVIGPAPAFFGDEAMTGEPPGDTANVREPSELVVVAGTALRATVLRNPFLALELAKALSDRPARR